MKAVIALGSNLGDRQAYLERAIDQISQQCGRILRRSSILETAAYGYTAQGDFLNMAVLADTILTPEALLHRLQSIELALGRVRTVHWGPRTIDLDLIYLEDRRIHTKDLVVPHPDRLNRLFVMEPVAELVPEWVDPEEQQTVRVLAEILRKRMV